MDNKTTHKNSKSNMAYSSIYINKKYKESVGIALCRRCPTTNLLQIILVHKRLSYSFIHFVFGRYKIESNNRELINLISYMNVNEKIQIQSLNFDHLWYLIWMNIPTSYNNNDQSYHKNWLKNYSNTDILSLNTKAFYNHCKEKFYNLVKNDGGAKLRNLIIKSPHCNNFLWEIPKGRVDESESTINCAIRELEEETCITPNQYNICFDIEPFTITRSYVDVKHKHTYYVAIMSDGKYRNHNPRINFTNIHQITEIDDLKWFSLNDIKILWKGIHNSYHLESLIKKIFKCIKNRKLLLAH